MFVTDNGQILGRFQNVLDYLHNKSVQTDRFIYELLYKAFGGCETCNAMWISIVLYPLYLFLGWKFGFASYPLSDPLTFVLMWLAAPAITYDILTFKSQ